MKKALRSEAEFSGMNAGREALAIGEVAHKAYIDVNEEGTEAAAATGVEIHPVFAPIRPAVPVFRADHPFAFAIYDLKTGVIMFLGRVVKP
jgi:serpin B